MFSLLAKRWCRCLPDANSASLIISGGNDGRVIVQNWTEGPAENSVHRCQQSESRQKPVEFKIHHGRKVNSLACNQGTLSSLYVADVSKRISVYNLR